ncbi:response regulator transcription factor [Nitratiruptor sp. SB155-2]|uniref:response regulator transcription factor n=1 Tax=Nitratiruptor sp. (strain SB155-2) TaxID=387092 RepID=UPI0001587327|nr:response regulator [Nitratiruptor sp. SB155-2]BAF70725.1 two-component response regulator [Nitratiruptor sp. SB155-2]
MVCESLLKGVKALYIEDEETIRNLMKEIFSGVFQRFDVAANLNEAKKLQEEHKYDLIISDIELGEKRDGLDFVHNVKEKDEQTVVVMLTAYSEKERLLKAIDAGVSRYLIKPVDPEELKRNICELLEKKYAKKVYDLGQGFQYIASEAKIVHNNNVSKLTKKEKKLLDLLLDHAGQIVPIQTIEETIWEDEECSNNALRTLVKRVRQKTYKELIKNYSGLGYSIEFN